MHSFCLQKPADRRPVLSYIFTFPIILNPLYEKKDSLFAPAQRRPMNHSLFLNSTSSRRSEGAVVIKQLSRVRKDTFVNMNPNEKESILTHGSAFISDDHRQRAVGPLSTLAEAVHGSRSPVCRLSRGSLSFLERCCKGVWIRSEQIDSTFLTYHRRNRCV